MPGSYKPKKLKLSKPKHVFLLLDKVVNAVKEGKMKPTQANVIVYATVRSSRRKAERLEKKVENFN